MPELLTELSRDRLLQASVEVFAAKGFQNGTVREICGKVGANVASVNYYFGNKEKLYAEALFFSFRQAEQRYPLTEAFDMSLTPQQRLTHFVRIFLNRILDDSALGHHGKLIAHEIADPTKALDDIVQTFIKPIFGLLSDIVGQLLGAVADQKQVNRCILGLLGQCLMFKHSRSVIDHLCADLIASPEEIQHCAEHITQFSLLALGGLAQQAAGEP